MKNDWPAKFFLNYVSNKYIRKNVIDKSELNLKLFDKVITRFCIIDSFSINSPSDYRVRLQKTSENAQGPVLPVYPREILKFHFSES